MTSLILDGIAIAVALTSIALSVKAVRRCARIDRLRADAVQRVRETPMATATGGVNRTCPRCFDDDHPDTCICTVYCGSSLCGRFGDRFNETSQGGDRT